MFLPSGEEKVRDNEISCICTVRKFILVLFYSDNCSKLRYVDNETADFINKQSAGVLPI